jgi:hypothetical protein
MNRLQISGKKIILGTFVQNQKKSSSEIFERCRTVGKIDQFGAEILYLWKI